MRSTRCLSSISNLTTWCTVLSISAVFVGCTVPLVNTTQLSISPGSPLVARKIQRPLVIVLDPRIVPDEFVMSSTKKQVEIREIREFVRRDLRGAMLSFFKNVEVIGPGTPIDPTAHVAHVRIDRFDAQETVPSTAGPGMNSQVYGRLTWSFALLPSKGRDYLFSYSDTTTGDYPLVRTGEVATMIESTYVRAIEQMVHRFIEDGAYRALLSLDEIPADTPPENFHQGESPLSNEVGHNEVPRSESTTPNRQDAPPLVDDQNMR